VLSEPDSKEAQSTVASYLKKGFALYTVDLALIEGLNVIWKHAALLKDIRLEEINSAVEDLTIVYDGLNIVPARELTTESVQIALKHNLSIYDALYIAASEKINGTLYTADQKLCNIAKKVTKGVRTPSTEADSEP